MEHLNRVPVPPEHTSQLKPPVPAWVRAWAGWPGWKAEGGRAAIVSLCRELGSGTQEGSKQRRRVLLHGSGSPASSGHGAEEQRGKAEDRRCEGQGAIDCGTCHIFKSRAEVSICHPIITFATPHCGPQPSHATKNSPMPKLTAAKMRVAISSSVE